MARLGHSSTRAAMIYQHATKDRDQAIARALGGLVQQVRATTPDPPEETVIAAASRSLGVDRASVQSGLRLGSAVPRLPSAVQRWPPEALSGSRAGLGEVGRVP